VRICSTVRLSQFSYTLFLSHGIICCSAPCHSPDCFMHGSVTWFFHGNSWMSSRMFIVIVVFCIAGKGMLFVVAAVVHLGAQCRSGVVEFNHPCTGIAFWGREAYQIDSHHVSSMQCRQLGIWFLGLHKYIQPRCGDGIPQLLCTTQLWGAHLPLWCRNSRP